MSLFDFPDAQPPQLKALQNSFAQNDIEKDLKNLTIELFRRFLSVKAFDVNVLGAAHLGTIELIRHAITRDGLVLLDGANENYALRYLYRAWKASDAQGRGKHFLRTYMQMLFPNSSRVEQLVQDKKLPYPTALYTEKEAQKKQLDSFLTSRVRIYFDLDSGVDSVDNLINVIRAVIPARFVPEFFYWLADCLDKKPVLRDSFARFIETRHIFPWCGLVLTRDPARKWALGNQYPRFDFPFEPTPILGKSRAKKLIHCRIQSTQTRTLSDSFTLWPDVYRRTLHWNELPLNGRWKLRPSRPPRLVVWDSLTPKKIHWTYFLSAYST